MLCGCGLYLRRKPHRTYRGGLGAAIFKRIKARTRNTECPCHNLHRILGLICAHERVRHGPRTNGGHHASPSAMSHRSLQTKRRQWLLGPMAQSTGNPLTRYLSPASIGGFLCASGAGLRVHRCSEYQRVCQDHGRLGSNPESDRITARLKVCGPSS